METWWTHIFTFEVFAFLTGVICVYLNARENIWGWPLGMVTVSLHLVVYFRELLYSDFVLQAIYFFLNAYGWYKWWFGGEEKDSLPVTRSKLPELGVFLLVGVGLMLAFGYVFDTYTKADLAYWDAFTTGFSLVAMYMMAKKKLENWLVWMVVDIVAIGIYLYKDLYFIALEFLVFLVICVYGYLGWRKSLSNNQLPG